MKENEVLNKIQKKDYLKLLLAPNQARRIDLNSFLKFYFLMNNQNLNKHKNIHTK